MLAWVVMNLLALITASRLALLAPGDGWPAKLVAFGQHWSALLIGSMLLAGSLHRLTVGWLCVIQAALFLIAWIATRQCPPWRWALLVRGLADGWSGLKGDVPLAAAVAVVTVAYLYVFTIGLIFPPATGDELLYHLPVALSFAEQEDLRTPVLSGFWKASLWAHYPANGSLLMSWLLLSGTDRVVDLVQLPFVVLCAAAVAAIGRRLGLSGRDAAWAALLFVSMPLVINQARASLNDITLAFFLLAALYWVLVPQAVADWRYGLLAGIPAGLAFGVKYSSAASLALIAIIGLVSALGTRGRPWNDRFRDVAVRAGIALLCLAAFGGYWYVRNYVGTGSATYPLGLLGEVRPQIQRLMHPGSFAAILGDKVGMPGDYNVYNVTVGIGIQSVALVFPAMAVLAAGIFFRQRRSLSILALAGLAGYFGWWIVAPPVAAGRYSIPWLGLGFVLAVIVIREFACGRNGWRHLALAMVVYSSALALPSVGSDLHSGSIIDGIASLRRTGSLPDPEVHRGDLMVYDYRQAWKWLAGQPAASRIAVVNHAFTYPLYKSRAGWNQLSYLPVRSRSQWLRELRDRQIDYVVTAPLRSTHFVWKVSPSGPLLTLVGVTVATSNEAAGAILSMDGQRATHVTIQYRTRFSGAAGALLAPSGTFFLTINDGEIMEPLPPASVPLTGESTWQTARLTLPAETTMTNLGFVYFDEPVTRLPVEARLVIAKLQLAHGEDNPDIPFEASGDRWTTLQDPIEEGWMKQFPEDFRLVGVFPDESVFGGGASHASIYQVLPGAAAGIDVK